MYEQASLLLVGLAGAVVVVASVLVGFLTPRGAAPAVTDVFEDLVTSKAQHHAHTDLGIDCNK